jgi:hypothetical protein
MADVCQICLDDISLLDGRPSDTLCSGVNADGATWHHKFHAVCINTWIKQKIREGETELKCPTCNRVVPPQTLWERPLDYWPEVMWRLNGVNVIVFLLTREMVQMLYVMRNTLAVMRETRMASGLGQAELEQLDILNTSRNSSGALAFISGIYLLISILFTMYIWCRTHTRRLPMRGGGNTLCMSVDGKEECVEIPDEMVRLVTDIMMQIKNGLPELEKGLPGLENSLKKSMGIRNTPRRNMPRTTRRNTPRSTRRNTARRNRIVA